jgi:hypothetical protein
MSNTLVEYEGFRIISPGKSAGKWSVYLGVRLMVVCSSFIDALAYCDEYLARR